MSTTFYKRSSKAQMTLNMAFEAIFSVETGFVIDAHGWEGRWK